MKNVGEIFIVSMKGRTMIVMLAANTAMKEGKLTEPRRDWATLIHDTKKVTIGGQQTPGRIGVELGTGPTA